MSKSKKCVLYAQTFVSPDMFTEDYSLGVHQAKLEKYAINKKLEIEKLFYSSANMENRYSIVDEMLGYVRRNNIDAIVIGTNKSLTMLDIILVDNWLNEALFREVHIAETGHAYTSENARDEESKWDFDVYMAKLYFRHHCEDRKKAQVLKEEKS